MINRYNPKQLEMRPAFTEAELRGDMPSPEEMERARKLMNK
jgi:hypothetical protein